MSLNVGSRVRTHECPAPGCDRQVPRERFACPRHWYSLPQRLRDALWRAWRTGAHDYMEIHALCVEELERQAGVLEGGA